MLSHIENHPPTSYTPWKPQIYNKTVVFAADADGVGHATAVMLAAHGAPVFLAASSIAALKQAFVDINRAGGECDGMVMDCRRAEECRRFFMLAEAWLGGIDAVVLPPAGLGSAGQYLCMQEAIQRMQATGRGRLINIELPGKGGSQSRGSKSCGPQNRSEQRIVSALRRQARDAGICVTLVEPEAGWQNEPAANEDERLAGAAQEAEGIARCVLESLAQPFGDEVVLVTGQVRHAN